MHTTATIALAAALASAAHAQQTVYDNFTDDHDGFGYNWGIGWTVAGEDVPQQYGVEQAIAFTPAASGALADVYVPVWYVPFAGGADEVTVHIATNDGAPPTPDDILESWLLTEFPDWNDWAPPHHLVSQDHPQLDADASYWIWMQGGPTTWCGWAHNSDPTLTLPHTLRRENEDWLPIFNETASALRVDVADACPADCNGDGTLNVLDFVCFQTAWQNQTPAGDCDDNGLYDILDFVCYQGRFQQGCP